MLNRYDLSHSWPAPFTNRHNLVRRRFSGTRRVGAIGALSSAPSGPWTIRLSSSCEVLTGSVVTKGGMRVGCRIPYLAPRVLSLFLVICVYYLDLFSLSYDFCCSIISLRVAPVLALDFFSPPSPSIPSVSRRYYRFPLAGVFFFLNITLSFI